MPVQVVSSNLVADQRGVAIHVGPHLRDGCLAVAARERDQVGLGHDDGDLHRGPAQALEAEDEAKLLGKRRAVVVVQDQVRHQGSQGIAR